MFKRSTIIAAISALLLGLGALPAGAGHADPFLGRWRSVDIDASRQSLTFAQSDAASDPWDTVEVELFDSNASQACQAGGPAVLEGEVTRLERKRLGAILVRFDSIVCRRGEPNPELEFPLHVEFVHHPDTDTLTDETGVEWHRVGPPHGKGKAPPGKGK